MGRRHKPNATDSYDGQMAMFQLSVLVTIPICVWFFDVRAQPPSDSRALKCTDEGDCQAFVQQVRNASLFKTESFYEQTGKICVENVENFSMSAETMFLKTIRLAAQHWHKCSGSANTSLCIYAYLSGTNMVEKKTLPSIVSSLSTWLAKDENEVDILGWLQDPVGIVTQVCESECQDGAPCVQNCTNDILIAVGCNVDCEHYSPSMSDRCTNFYASGDQHRSGIVSCHRKADASHLRIQFLRELYIWYNRGNVCALEYVASHPNDARAMFANVK